MADKVPCILRTAGFTLCLLYIVYMLYVTASWRAAAELDTSGERAVTVAGVFAVAEGVVVRAEKGCTIIRYYYEWDGTDYQKVITHGNADYPLNAKVPIVYVLGMGPGSCLVAGMYKNPMQVLIVVGALLSLSGITLNLKRKGMGRNGKKKDRSR